MEAGNQVLLGAQCLRKARRDRATSNLYLGDLVGTKMALQLLPIHTIACLPKEEKKMSKVRTYDDHRVVQLMLKLKPETISCPEANLWLEVIRRAAADVFIVPGSSTRKYTRDANRSIKQDAFTFFFDGRFSAICTHIGIDGGYGKRLANEILFNGEGAQ